MHRYIVRAVGRPTESWISDGIKGYVDRLKPFAKVELIEVAEGHGGSAKPDETKTRKAESESLLKGLPDNALVIALDEAGKNLSSTQLATYIKDEAEGGRPVAFLIGGSWGLDQNVRDRADLILSFGKQTLPHSLARLVLLEQLYRAETINRGKEYHK